MSEIAARLETNKIRLKQKKIFQSKKENHAKLAILDCRLILSITQYLANLKTKLPEKDHLIPMFCKINVLHLWYFLKY